MLITMYSNLYHTPFSMLMESRSSTPFMRGRDVVECTTLLHDLSKRVRVSFAPSFKSSTLSALHNGQIFNDSPLHLNLEEEHEILGDTQELM